MSGANRVPHDFYETPAWLTEAILSELYPHGFGGCWRQSPRRILEPVAGAWAIVRVLAHYWPDAAIDGFDIAPPCSGAGIIAADFLKLPPRPEYDLVITNPPYSLALEFVQAALKWRRDHCSFVPPVMMLLRLGFLAGQKRGAWLRAHTPSIFVSPRPPSFDGEGSDNSDYAWFVWDHRRPPIVRILETEAGAQNLKLFE